MCLKKDLVSRPDMPSSVPHLENLGHIVILLEESVASLGHSQPSLDTAVGFGHTQGGEAKKHRQ